MWEIGTKKYFEHQHLSNGSTVDCKIKLPGITKPLHVDRVQDRLAMFAILIHKELIEHVNEVRKQVNTTKHQTELFITEDDYHPFIAAKKWALLF